MTVRRDWQARYTWEVRFGGDVVRRFVPPYPPERDLDPEVYNFESAWWDPNAKCYKATKHGGFNIDKMRACGCGTCTAQADHLDRVWKPSRVGAAEAPRIEPVRVPAGPVRERVEELVEAGWSLARIAEHAGVDASTLSRLRRFSAVRVNPATAAGVLAVPGSPTTGG